MTPIRVLIVDDSVVVRRILAKSLDKESDIQVERPAPNGTIAINRVRSDVPDVVILDVEMPGINGFETLRELRRIAPRLPVIMFSTLTDRGAAATIEALALGASDYMAKPSAVSGLADGLSSLQSEMVSKIRALCPRQGPAERPAPRSSARPTARPSASPVEIVAIGVSTGGPNALADVFSGFSSAYRTPTLIVQHMPPTFTRLLAQRLDKNCPLHVREGEDGAPVAAGDAWVAPGDYHMVLAGNRESPRLQLTQGEKVQSCRPAVDVLFESVAKQYGSSALAVVLTGMGQDGLRGSEAIHSAGGRVIAQDEATSVVWGMPGYVARANLADEVLPLHEVASTIESICRSAQAVRS